MQCIDVLSNEIKRCGVSNATPTPCILCVFNLQKPNVEDNLSKIFDRYTTGASEMDANELMHALNAVFHAGTYEFWNRLVSIRAVPADRIQRATEACQLFITTHENH